METSTQSQDVLFQISSDVCSQFFRLLQRNAFGIFAAGMVSEFTILVDLSDRLKIIGLTGSTICRTLESEARAR